MKRKRYTTKR